MFQHQSVLLQETIERVFTNPSGVYVDMTLGGGGHSEALSRYLAPDALLIGLDRDEDAIAAAGKRLANVNCRVELVHINYKEIVAAVKGLGLSQVDGIICDLGVSSYQLDTAERGFSYRQDGRLDMRMDRNQSWSAYDVVNGYSAADLTRIIKDYGEERWAKRIASFIAEARKEKPIETTAQLTEIIRRAIPKAARKDGPHPAKRTFQAIRIEVNGELEDLRQAMEDAVSILKVGGRLGVITFHSLEDRIVKNTFKELSTGCTCPPMLPMCVCGQTASVKLMGKSIAPGEAELAENHRARSARLRVVEKI